MKDDAKDVIRPPKYPEIFPEEEIIDTIIDFSKDYDEDVRGVFMAGVNIGLRFACFVKCERRVPFFIHVKTPKQ